MERRGGDSDEPGRDGRRSPRSNRREGPSSPGGATGGGRRTGGDGRDRRATGGGRRTGGDDRDRRATQGSGAGPRGDRSRDGTGGPPADPELVIDDDITGDELDPEVAAELGSLSKGAARAVAKHLVMAGRLLDDDPDRAYRYTMEARRRAARIGVVREAAGVAAYMAGRYAEALAELRAARRITGSAEYLPVMADCERGLGRPRRALDLASDPASTGLPLESRIEMLIVAAGARRDLGDIEAAVVSLQVPELRSQAKAQWVARLRYAYADLLEAAGRREEARRWFVRALDADVADETDAAERVTQLDDRPV
ncbi:MAG TPA: hypothetical protein VFZ72_06100 [Jiangellaceae bacterium]